MRIRIIWTIASFATLLLTTTGPGEAAGTQVRARFAFDALATCTQPPVQAFPVHAEGFEKAVGPNVSGPYHTPHKAKRPPACAGGQQWGRA